MDDLNTTPIGRRLLSLERQVQSLIKRGYVTMPSNDTGDNQTPQTGTLGGSAGRPVLIYPYGTAGNPTAGTPVLIMNVMGDPSNQVATPYLDKERFKDPSTDYAIYSPESGSVIKIKKDGRIEVESSSSIQIEADGEVNIRANSSVNINGLTTLNDPVGVLPPLPIARVGDTVNDLGGTPIGVIATGSTINSSS